MEYKAMTTRMPLVVYEAVQAYRANDGSISINQFVVEAVEQKLAQAKEQELKKGFALLAEDFDMKEVEPWIEAQREAFKHIDD